MTHIHKYFIIVLMICVLATGCAPKLTPSPVSPTTQPTQNGEGEVEPVRLLQSDKSRIENPQAAEADLDRLEGGNRAFALDLYQQLRVKDGNQFYSPYSISLALAMTFAGARGETESQMAQAMHFDLPQASLHPAINALSLKLASRAQPAGEDQEGGLMLNIANSLWGQAGFAFQSDFMDMLAESYGAGMREVDFANSEQARQLINDWVAEETRDKIKDLIPSGALNPLTRLVLANAIYFKAAWQYPFEEQATSKDDFTLLEGEVIQADTMRQSKMFGYAKGDGYQSVELPYSGRSTSMLIFLPDEDRFEEFEAALDSELITDTLDNLTPAQVELSLPKFKVESTFSLNEALAALGMPDAFDADKADFSGMTGQPDLFISSVVHKAFVDVNEAGTEAAAATAVIMELKAMPSESVTLKINRPFIFAIIDRETGTILFMGRVLDPR